MMPDAIERNVSLRHVYPFKCLQTYMLLKLAPQNFGFTKKLMNLTHTIKLLLFLRLHIGIAVGASKKRNQLLYEKRILQVNNHNCCIIIIVLSFLEGWLKIDVTYVIRNWLEYQDSPTHAINVACKTCGMDSSNSPISFKNTLKPFLVIYTHSQARRAAHRRQKRSSDCDNGIHECCREKLYVSFAEIGWDDWILQPPGYNAYFCKGSCTTAASLTLSATQHNNILQVNI